MRIFIIICILVVLEAYGFQALKTITTKRWIHLIYGIVSLGIICAFFIPLLFQKTDQLNGVRAYSFGLLLALLVGQLVVFIFLFTEDVYRLIYKLFSSFQSSKPSYMPSRRKFITTLALAVSAIPFSSLLYGMIRGKYNYKVLKYELEFEDLPEAFDGYKITQISDLHCGSFDNYQKVKYGIDLINEQESDALFFTGDLINTKASELEDWEELLTGLKAEDGVYSILGNHDYGEYYRWDSEAEKEDNFQQLLDLQEKMGWTLLRNSNTQIRRKDQTLHIVGVENWGKGNFPKYGDLEKAATGLSAQDFKIVLSHDPSHWEEIIQKDEKNYQLTLSGHTHGMQFGIEVPGFIKWSPVQYRYKYWAGIYQSLGRYINVNRGFGFLAYPGRVGIWPEITVIKLVKK